MAIFEGSFTNASTLKVGIVIARFNDLITNKILSGCLDCLKRHGLDTSELSNQVDIAWVPGSFELPIAAKTLMKKKSYDVVIALGAVIRGETSHYDVVISEASKGISQVSNDNNRAQLLSDLEHVIERASSRNRDRLSGQGNLFDSREEFSRVAFSDSQLAKVDDYSLIEKLKLEKQLLGFYLSDHPLKHLTKPAKLVSPISISQLEETKDRTKVSLVGMIPDLKQITTRKGDRMAIVQLEDLSGSCEAIVFPKTYVRLSEFLLTDTRLLFWGTIDKKSDKTQLIIDDCREIDNLKLLIINLESSQASDVRVQNTLRNCLTKFKPDKNRCGIKIPVLAAVRNEHSVTYVKFGDQFCIGDIQGACKLLEENSFQVNLKSLVS